MRRRRLTEAEWEAELQHAKEVLAADVELHTITWPPVPGATAYNLYCGPPGNPGRPLVVRTPPNPEAGWEAELAAAAATGDWRDQAKVHLRRIQSGVEEPLVVRTPPRRGRWSRPWARRAR